MEYISPKQAAEKWGIGQRRVQFLCANGKIQGAINMGRHWIIPENAERPEDGRTKKKIQVSPKEDYHFPLLLHTRFYAAEDLLNENEKLLLKAQLLHYQGDQVNSIRLSRELIEKKPEHYLVFGAYCTIAYNYIVLGLYREYLSCRRQIDMLAETAFHYPEDYRLIISHMDGHTDLNYIPYLKIDPNRLSPEALPFLKMLLLVTDCILDARKDQTALLHYEAFVRELTLEGFGPTLFSAHAMLPHIYDLAGKTEAGMRHGEIACQMAVDYGWLPLLAKYFPPNQKILSDVLKQRDPTLLPKIRQLMDMQQNGWRIFYYAKHHLNADKDPDGFRRQLLFLLALDYGDVSIAITLNLSEEEIAAKIKALCKEKQLADRAALVQYAVLELEKYERSISLP